MKRIIALLALAVSVFFSAAALAQTPVSELARAPEGAQTWAIVSPAGRHGTSQRWSDAQGVRWSRESILLRGFVTEVDQQLRLAADGSLAGQIVRGVTPSGDASESFSAADGRYEFRSPVDRGEGAAPTGSFYASLGGTIDSAVMLADALRAAPGRGLDLLPSGRAQLEELVTQRFSNGSETKTLTAYAIIGTGLAPFPIWYEGERFFAAAGFLSWVPVGWEGAAPELIRAQEEALSRRAAALVARIAPRATLPVVFQNVRLYDAENRSFREGMTVIVEDGRISSVGPAGETQLPAQAVVYQGAGRTLAPGLWDSHMHYGSDDTGPLLLSQGITSARDPGNNPDSAPARLARIASGEILGTRVVASMLIDGVGPNAAQAAVAVRNRNEALAAIRRARAEGYFGVKFYGSLDPAWVRPMAQLSRRLGLRVHGHIPRGMRPLEAVRAGYNEITHINWVMMQGMPDSVIQQSNGLQRFYGPAQFGPGVELRSGPFSAFLDELRRSRIAVDPTISTFEPLYVPEAGEMPAGYAPLAGTLPPQLERGLRAGGLQATLEVSREQMRAGFRALVALVGELHRRGITILAGTDGFGIELVRELELYVEAGMTPGEALATATIIPAREFGVSEQTGAITVGRRAELFLVEGDPSRNIGDLRNVVVVMRDGRLMQASDLRAAVGISGPPRR
jgi:cytosine/adenosine deaminase-related metal-dependent hydrolase